MKRSALPNGPFHVIAHAVANEPLFCDDVDRKVYLGLLQQTIERYGWKLLTFVLMGNHVHLLVVTATCDLSMGLWWLHWKYAEHFHRRHPPRRGHVLESRPKTPPIKDERYLFAVLRYIANNPVKHGFCARPDDYRWSAHRVILGASSPLPIVAADDVLELFSDDAAAGRAAYAAFVAGDDAAEHREVRRWAEGARRDRPPLSELLAGGDSIDAIRSAHLEWDYSMRAIAKVVGLNPTTVSRRINGRR